MNYILVCYIHVICKNNLSSSLKLSVRDEYIALIWCYKEDIKTTEYIIQRSIEK